MTRYGIRINHPFFEDYCFLFCRATIKEWIHLENLLNVYKLAFGQMLNMQKSCIFFSSNTTIQNMVLEVLGARKWGQLKIPWFNLENLNLRPLKF